MTCREVSIDIVQPKSGNMQPRGGASGRVSIPLSGKVERFTRMQSENSIFEVHNHLREINKKAYEPGIIAIGPYHHGNEKLSMMEEHKVRYLHKLVQRKKENVDRYIEAMRKQEEKVRNFYAESLSLSSDELVEMMVLDGCFIIELVCKTDQADLRDPNDPIFKTNWMMKSLQRDLMLFENQLPFMLLRELFGMVEKPNDNRFILLLSNFFGDILPGLKGRWCDRPEYSLDKVKHLLDLIHINWVSPIPKKTPDDDFTNGDGRFIRCATELREAGVKFEKIEGGSLFDISFTKATLKIPTLIIEDRTETFLRNLIAHEQYCDPCLPMPVTEYARFMDCLINSSKDVQILCRHGTIDNLLGDDEVVSDIFNKITDSVIVQSNFLRYADIVKRLDSHCNKRRHRWMAKLRHNIFNSPWAIISFAAATLLLILTVIQTTFSVFPRN